MMPDQTLAQRIKAKYPGAYDDIPDAALEASIRAKYPGVYDDIPKTAPANARGGLLSAIGASIAGPVGLALQGAARVDPDTAVNALPAVGGAIGGLVGIPAGPGAIGTAALGGAAGEAAKEVINQMRGKPALAPVDSAKAMATEGAIQGGAQAVGAGIGKAAAWAGPAIMQTALKPTIAMLKEYGTTAPAVVKTLLDEGVNVTPDGIAKLQGLLTATNNDIRAAIQSATGTISKNAVEARVLPTAAKIAQQVNPAADLEAVGNTVENFTNHPVYTGPTVTVPEAQAMKVGTYQQIGKKYGEVSSAGIETQKALARGLKEEIATSAPGVADLNQRDSELMAALDAVGRRVAVAGNRDPVGFAWVAQHPTTFLAALIDRNPAVKSMLARGLYQSAGIAANVSPQLIRAAVVALTTGGSAPVPEQK